MRLLGLHHVTAICADLERTTAFYRDLLGLALVREGVNDDDPDARHFWFGDAQGTPGTLVSFMEYPAMEPGRLDAPLRVRRRVAGGADRLARLSALARRALHRRVRPRRRAVDLPARSRRPRRRDRVLGLTHPDGRRTGRRVGQAQTACSACDAREDRRRDLRADIGMHCKNFRHRVWPQRRWLVSRSETVMDSACHGLPRITSAALISP
jgi:catechol 2,3-dioxygenase-like lactoylglutathione lyase family enzyme